MAYSVPTTASGQVLTSAIWNASVRDNIIFLNAYGPEAARAEVTNSATQSIGNASATALAFNTENADGFAMHSGSGTRLTAPAGWAGWWLVAGAVNFAANATGLRNLAIIADGSFTVAAITTAAISGLDHQVAVSGIVRLPAASYVELFAYQSSGGALNVQSGPYFRAVWLANT
jgi:hypothetical protein